MEEIREVYEIDIYDEDSRGPDGGEPLVFQAKPAEYQAKTTGSFTASWNSDGIVRFEADD